MEAAVRSGLCGLLGDAVVQMVDVGDEDRLREVQALYVGYTLEKQPLVNALSTHWQVVDSKRPRKYGGKSRMDYPRVHVAAGTRQRDRHSWDENYSLLLTK
ncbi:hypothetical protein N7465_002637 [Penicillium sp. CMV-2018d]|nr:hypothetical protein N7465_002637 [Penicillium sp. CMV-2018d]